MDPTLSSGIGLQRPISSPNKNTFSQDVPFPQIWINPPINQINPVSFLSEDIESKLTELANVVNQLSVEPEVFRYLTMRLDPMRGILPQSKNKLTKEYHDLRTLDILFKLTSSGSKVLLCSPRSREYFVEAKCIISVMLLNTYTTQDATSISLMYSESQKNTPDDWFYKTAVNSRLVDLSVIPLQNLDTFEDRWRETDRYLATSWSNLTDKMDLIVFDEDQLGRTIDEYYRPDDNRGIYDIFLMEPLFKMLKYLKKGGSVVVHMISLGSRLNADIAYLFKYLFFKISIMKTATSMSIGQEHYLIAQGFDPARFELLEPQLLKFLSEMDNIRIQSIDPSGAEIAISFNSFINNLQDVIVPNGPITNFKNWFAEVTNEIAIFVGNNIDVLRLSLLDLGNGFVEYQPPVVLDHTGVRAALNYPGRSVTKLPLPPHQTDSPSEQGIVKNQSVIINKELSSVPKYIFIVHAIHNIIDEILNLPQWMAIYRRPFPIDEVRKMSTYYGWRDKLVPPLKEWFGLLWSVGDLQLIFREPTRTLEILKSRNWEVPMLAPLKSTLDHIAVIIQRWVAENAKMQPSNIQYRCVALKNQRFRLTYSIAGINYSLIKSSEGAIGEYELLNLLTASEIETVGDENITPATLSRLIETSEFRTRIFEHVAPPCFLHGISNEIAVPDLYFRLQPDLECFASASNRYAPHWCSANSDDLKLGSLGNFFDLQPSNPLLGTTILTMMAFPPSNILIFEKTMKHVIDIYNHQVSKKTPYFGVFIVFENVYEFTTMAEETCMNNGIISESTIIRDSYNPFTGITNNGSNLKLIRFEHKQ